MLDHTHDAGVTSWVAGADAAGADFPVQNLPFCIMREAGSGQAFRGGVGIGDRVLDLGRVDGLGDAAGQALAAARAPGLNGLMALGEPHWRALRHALFAALRTGSADAARLRPALLAQAGVEFGLPAVVGDFTDFYTSLDHATAVGLMLRPQNPLMPNYKWLPVAYHGRSSSVAVSPQRVVRPSGQWLAAGAAAPVLGPSARVDFELELGFWVGPGNALGCPVGVDAAEAHVFGACVLNDWSARDIQAWEYQPLGPFLGKNFATTVSPWVVTMAALAPFRVGMVRPAGDPAPLPHLAQAAGAAAGIDIGLEVALRSAAMAAAGAAPQVLATSNFRHAYWSVAQMVAHHTSNGCNLRPGDLLGSGTQSGPGAAEMGSMVELTRGGQAPVVLPTGERRGFLADGDRVVMRAWCEREGARRIGFGVCEGSLD